MNDKDKQYEELESILNRAHLPGPSSELKNRILAEATSSWNQIPAEISWQIPVRRLVVSAAAAVFVIWLANCFSDYSLARWQSSGSKIANQQRSDFDELTEIPYSPLARHLVSAGQKSTITDTSVLRNYAETMLRILDEAQQNGVSKPPAPVEGRSRLLPRQPGFNSYS